MRNGFKSFVLSIEDTEGASSVEYAILIVLISSVIISSVGLLGISTRDAFNTLDVVWSEEDKCGDKDSPDDADCGGGND